MTRARATLLCALLVVVLGAPRAARADAPDPGDYAIGEQGHRFRVRFDPASRIRLGVAEALRVGTPGDHPVGQAPEVTAGFTYRTRHTKGGGRERIVWQVDHRIASGWVHPFALGARPVPAMDAVLYEVDALRHDESPSIVIPASPPMGIPFPFDVGFESEIGRVTVLDRFPLAKDGGVPVPDVHLGVMRAALILDPWRTGQAGRSLEIGVGARYDLDAYALPSLSRPRVVHRVAPMTAASLRFRYQTDDGLTTLDVRGDAIPHWTSEGIWRLAATSTARFEHIVIAINDQPFTAMVEAGYRLTPATLQTEAVHDVRLSLGLAFDLMLR